MKIRNNFVSNSSSSSFIVFLTHRPRDVAETQEMFLPNRKTYSCYDSMEGEEVWSATKIAEILFKDLEASKELNIDDIVERMECGYIQGLTSMDWPDYKDTKKWNEHKEKQTKIYREYVESKIKSYCFGAQHPVCLSVNYSDNDGSMFAAMEHGPLFDGVPRIVVSHH